MAENQEERIKRIFSDAGFNMTEAAEKLEISRATLYNKINKHPLEPNFVYDVKTKLSIDLDTFKKLDIKKPNPVDQAELEDLRKEVEILRKEVTDLQRELLQFYKKK